MSELEKTIAKLEILRLKSSIQKTEKMLEHMNRRKEEKEASAKTLRLIAYLLEFVRLDEHYAETLEMIANNLDSIPDLQAIKKAIDNAEGRYKYVMELFGNVNEY